MILCTFIQNNLRLFGTIFMTSLSTCIAYTLVTSVKCANWLCRHGLLGHLRQLFSLFLAHLIALSTLYSMLVVEIIMTSRNFTKITKLFKIFFIHTFFLSGEGKYVVNFYGKVNFYGNQFCYFEKYSPLRSITHCKRVIRLLRTFFLFNFHGNPQRTDFITPCI